MAFIKGAPYVDSKMQEATNGAPGRPQNYLTRKFTDTQNGWVPDVHAPAWVPYCLVAINLSATSHTVFAEALVATDFLQYAASFAGKDQLGSLPIATISPTTRSDVHVDLDRISPENYAAYFQHCLSKDVEGQKVDLGAYNLYENLLQIVDFQQGMYSLHVPGLRENTPRVALGDTVYLRQLLWTTRNGLAEIMKSWIQYEGIKTGTVAPGFTGRLLAAVVVNVNKAAQNVLLHVVGMDMNCAPICNVSFAISDRQVLGLQRALSSTAENITTGLPSKTSRLESSASPSNSTDEPRRKHWLNQILFPDKGDCLLVNSLPNADFKQQWYDRGLNYEQKKAIHAVHSQHYGNVPYLISGPPGTGKTKTIVEMILQISLRTDLGGAILVCAPSEAAADTVAVRLLYNFNPKQLFRLMHYSRTFEEVPGALLPYCFVENNLFAIPPFPQLMAMKVVITTCRDADMLVQARVTNRDLCCLQRNIAMSVNSSSSCSAMPVAPHWSSLLIDEAAQATEIDALVPLTVVAPPMDLPISFSPSFVMAGDQHQLGPRTYSHETTFSTSLFERISNLPLYADHPYSRKNQIPQSRRPPSFPMIRPPFSNLIRNYRSHPAILGIPSTLFYADTLIPCATDTHSLEPWTRWRGRGWPVLFSVNDAPEACEDLTAMGGTGSGWFNTSEAFKAISYAIDLLRSNLISDQNSICIMAPSGAQVRLLRRLCRAQNLHDINVGPMEAFQGLESLFVIICTTRTTKKHVSKDIECGFGMVGFKKRFNVAVTRARMGLVVIGNPEVLEMDECWRAFMGFCWRNGLWESGESEVEREAKKKENMHVKANDQGLQTKEARGKVAQEKEAIESGIGKLKNAGTAIADKNPRSKWKDANNIAFGFPSRKEKKAQAQAEAEAAKRSKPKPIVSLPKSEPKKAWQPREGSENERISSLENALIYDDKVSRVIHQSFGGINAGGVGGGAMGQYGDEAMWTSGHAAEAALREL